MYLFVLYQLLLHNGKSSMALQGTEIEASICTVIDNVNINYIQMNMNLFIRGWIFCSESYFVLSLVNPIIRLEFSQEFGNESIQIKMVRY